MDDIRSIIQDELRQALTGLMPPSPAATIPIAPTIPSLLFARLVVVELFSFVIDFRLESILTCLSPFVTKHKTQMNLLWL